MIVKVSDIHQIVSVASVGVHTEEDEIFLTEMTLPEFTTPVHERNIPERSISYSPQDILISEPVFVPETVMSS